MKTITLKIDETTDQKVRIAMFKHNYATVTEFYRESVRNQLDLLEKKEAMKVINELYGSGKRLGKNTTDKDIKKARQKVAKYLEKKFSFD